MRLVKDIKLWAVGVLLFMVKKIGGNIEITFNHECKEIIREVIKQVEVPQDKIVWIRRRKR